jgi:DNA-binding MarR family transcriptional regulator
VGKKFINKLRNLGTYDPEDGDWGSWVEGDEDDEAGWYRLPPHEMFIPDYHPGMSDGEIEKVDRSIRDWFVKFVGGIQRDILTELKSAAENAIYVEKWYELLRESISVPITTKLKWSDLTPVQRKIIETLAKSNGVLVTSGQIALNLGMQSSEISDQLKSNAKLKANGLVETKVGTKGGSFLTEIGWSLYNTRPTGLEY